MGIPPSMDLSLRPFRKLRNFSPYPSRFARNCLALLGFALVVPFRYPCDRLRLSNSSPSEGKAAVLFS